MSAFPLELELTGKDLELLIIPAVLEILAKNHPVLCDGVKRILKVSVAYGISVSVDPETGKPEMDVSGETFTIEEAKAGDVAEAQGAQLN